MNDTPIFSSSEELHRIATILSAYASLPFVGKTIPGAILESVLANVRVGRSLGTYDFIDVLKADSKCGWQVKSTKSSTPVTWKRAKIPDRNQLINASLDSEKGAQVLGKAIIDFCNNHVAKSFHDYNLNEIGYSRLIVHPGGQITYFEKLLCTKNQPALFNDKEFFWKWSKPKKTITKEQLPALHGTHIPTGEKWWAWHGHGENQLHFSGEHNWWPKKGSPNFITFQFPESKRGLDAFLKLLESAV